MYIEQLYTNCLAEAAYWIESDGEAAVIDPLRETEPYLKKAAERGVKIKYVFETHFHADFVSGHIDLAKATGATIVFGPTHPVTHLNLLAIYCSMKIKKNILSSQAIHFLLAMLAVPICWMEKCRKKHWLPCCMIP
jgi:glyoxylase-like metal-dependent hydrolase (beta-lactamase superfamily II)